jgi:phage-related protein
LNGPADGGDWGAKEVLAGQDCADAANSNDRILDPVGADDYRIEFCFGECTVECPALDTTAPVITLVGDNPVEVYEGATYTDAGATASDDVDGDLTASIVVVNPVDTSVIGEYTITYNVSDAAGNPATEVTRTVNVVADPCPVVAGAWAHTFDVVEGTVPDAACWLVANGGDANTWVVNTNGEWQIQYSSTAHDDYLISPAFTVISGTSDRFSFEARNQSTFYLETMDVQVWDAGITTMLGTLATAVGPGTANEAYEYALSAYAGQDVRVAFHITTTDQFYMYVDNVTVDAIPSCQAPTDLSVSGVTATEATVAWSSPNDGDSFEYQVVEGGTTPAETGTATSDSSVDLTGLSSVTTYDFYVRSVCSDGSLSDWSSVSFTTELQAPGCGETLSYDYPTGSSGGSQFANNFAGADASDLLFTSTVDNAGDELTLTIGGSTESGWDWVYVTDGAGTVLLAPVSGAMDYEVVSSDGTVNVYIASDTSVTSGPVIFAVSCDAPFDPPTWVGDWVLDPVAGALAVGPTATDLGWWSSSAADVDTRACLFDDIWSFNEDGTFEIEMQGSTWLEGWQTGAGEECGTPVAPHDGSNPATYSYTGDTVTVVGDGAFLGLAKVHNGGEDGNPVDDTITYNIVSVDDNYLVVNINFGPGYWQFRFRDANYAPPTTDVTFAVNTANIEVGASGMFLGGGIFGDAQAHAMSDDDGDGIWEVTLTLNEGTTGNYIFLNGPADGGDWGAKEVLAGQDCADAANNNDRILDPVGADDYRIEFCFEQCTLECPALDTTAPVITLVGDNPVEVYEGATYTDAGATASDDVDGDLTASIVVVNPVDTSVIGEYTITYNVSDAAGNPATEVTRTVNVVADPCPVVAGAWAHTFDVVEGTVPDAACWLVANGGDANTWVVNTNGEWQIQYSSTAHDDYLISPAFTVISGTSDRFSFEARNQSTFYLETMDVQVWDAGVTTMLGTLATAVGPGTANEAYEYALSAYAGQDVRVAFHITTTDQFYMYVDNVTVDAIPSCQAPTDLSVSGVTATEATVAWSSPNDGDSFEYQVVEGGTTPAETGTATSDSSVDLTGLSSVTTYDFYVRSVCSDGSLSDWSSVSFTTELQAPGCGETLSYDYPTGSSGGSQFANNFAGADASDLLFTSTVDNAGDELTLTIGGSTESGWDWVYVTDGAGTVLLAPVSGAMDYEVVSSDGTVNVYIASDTSVTSGPVIFAVSCDAPFDPPTWVGDWVLDPVAGALAVGPTATDLGWWSNSAADVDTRACLFDDIWSFNEDGTFEIEMQGSTWLEGWQTGAGEECGTPVAPHDGSNPATYSYTGDTVTVVGDGAFLGLAKVHNGGEDGNPVDDTITYNIVSVDDNYLVVNINFGPGYWQFRFRDANYAPPTTDVTFAVNTANIEVGASGMFLGGGIFGDAQAHAMSDDDGDGIWEVTLTLNEGTTGNYIFLNGPADGGDWGAKEVLAGQECADAANNNDRILDPVGADDYRIEFCFEQCTVECTPLGLDDPSMSQFTYFPNPVNDQLTINSQRDVKDITVYNMLGQVVVRQTPNMRNCTVDMSSMQTGAYFVQVSIGNTVETVRVLKK